VIDDGAADPRTVALVTGGNQGLGFALVRGLRRRLGGESVVYLAARNGQRGQRAVDELRQEGLRAAPLLLDVRDTAQVNAAADLLRERHGGADIWRARPAQGHPAVPRHAAGSTEPDGRIGRGGRALAWKAHPAMFRGTG
jgi:NAD(P)-dependent dehydrogenase (short-subunit alcohol dehydrogenase family)